MRHLLHFDTVRGEHSTGVAVVDTANNTGLYKEVGIPQNLYNTYPKEFPRGFFNCVGIRLLMGHNRFATQGEVNVDNAHPFDMGNIVGAHNGTVLKSSLSSLEGYDFHTMDSKILFNHLNATNDLPRLWSKADGPIALTWWNKEERSLNIVRNKDRSLFYALVDGGKKIYWASEDWMLFVALSRSGIKIKDKIEVVPINKHHIITLDDKGDINIEVKELAPFAPAPYPNHHQYGRTSGGNHHGKGWNAKHVPVVQKREVGKFAVDFLIECFVPLQVDKANRATTGYFKGTTDNNQKIRVGVTNITHKMESLIKVVNGSNIALRFTTNKAEYIHDKKTGTWGLFVLFPDVQAVKKTSDNNVIDLKPVPNEVAYDIYGQKIDKAKFEHLTKSGCDTCKCVITWDMREMVGWNDVNRCNCPKCEDNLYQTYKNQKKIDYIAVGPNVVDKNGWESLSKDGCCECGNPVFWEDREKTTWKKVEERWTCTCSTCNGKYN